MRWRVSFFEHTDFVFLAGADGDGMLPARPNRVPLAWRRNNRGSAIGKSSSPGDADAGAGWRGCDQYGQSAGNVCEPHRGITVVGDLLDRRWVGVTRRGGSGDQGDTVGHDARHPDHSGYDGDHSGRGPDRGDLRSDDDSVVGIRDPSWHRSGDHRTVMDGDEKRQIETQTKGGNYMMTGILIAAAFAGGGVWTLAMFLAGSMWRGKVSRALERETGEAIEYMWEADDIDEDES